MGLSIQQINDFCYRIPRQGKMRVDGRIFANAQIMAALKEDKAITQVANVAHLPGIVGASFAMPDIHWGYGFPIGGVAAFDAEQGGVVSPGGVGYDINCGVRLLRSDLSRKELRSKLPQLVNRLFDTVPTGVGAHRRDFRLSEKDYDKLLTLGAAWVVQQGYGDGDDLEHIEKSGCIPGADSSRISTRAKERGRNQLGSLGSGNHFLEVQYVDEIYDTAIAHALDLFPEQITVSIHCGSRGFGHQTCDDALATMLRASQKYGIDLPDRQLCCAPIDSKEGQDYLKAMACAANYAFGNRQLITHWVRQSFEEILHRGPAKINLRVVYDVCHNIATFENHRVNGKESSVLVHRKGATRAFPPQHPQTPAAYREVGQPVLIPGDMGRYSFVLVGTQKAFDETFASSCHGAGRLLSRKKASKVAQGRAIVRELEDQGIYVRSAGVRTLKEEIPEAYKDVANVVDVVEGAGISKKVARLRPIGVIKG